MKISAKTQGLRQKKQLSVSNLLVEIKGKRQSICIVPPNEVSLGAEV